jgi:hypothetical protein
MVDITYLVLVFCLVATNYLRLWTFLCWLFQVAFFCLIISEFRLLPKGYDLVIRSTRENWTRFRVIYHFCHEIGAQTIYY